MTSLVSGYSKLFFSPRLAAPMASLCGFLVLPTFAVHHSTALIACQIIANNASTGFLSISRERAGRIQVPPDGILTEKTYYFILEEDSPYGYADLPMFSFFF
jgi:hypothetical protein